MELARGYVHILGGASGAGKTTVALQCVRKMQDHEPNWLGLHGKSVGWLTGDRGDEQTQEKADKLGIKNTEFLSLFNEGHITDGELEKYLSDHPHRLLYKMIGKFTKPHDLIVCDPIAIFCMGDMNSYQPVSKTLILLSRRLLRMKVSFLGLTHAPKIKLGAFYGKAEDNILGSGAWQAFADSLFTLTGRGEDDVIRLTVKGHTHKDYHIALVRKEGGWLSDDPLDFPTGSENGDSKEGISLSTRDIIDWIKEEGRCSEPTAYRKLKEFRELLSP